MNVKSITAAAPHLEYLGGKILTAPKFVSIFYGDYWNTAQGVRDRAYQDKFAASLVKGSYTSIWREYGSGAGKFLGSVQLNSTNPSKVTEAGIQKIIANGLATGTIQAGPAQTVYTVFLPPGAVLESGDGTSSREGMGGYHGSFNLRPGKKIYYAAIVFPAPGNGINFTTKPKDSISIVASHEWSEAVTDPDVNNGKTAWYDMNYGEIGDIPINIGMQLKDVFGRLGGFAVQKEWSNRLGEAVLEEK